MSAQPVLAYCGLGIMGQPMARRLLAAGYRLHVWNRSRGKLAALVEAGALPAETAAEAARAADIVMMCLTDADAVEAVVFGPGGIAEGGGSGRILVDFSSIAPDRTRALAARLEAACGMAWIDAPVSGGSVGAAEGTLAVMAGGTEEAVSRARPVIEVVAGNLTHMGPVGTGQVTKLCNQVVVGCQMAVIAEAVRLAQAAGVAAERLPQALKGGWADSKPLQIFTPRMAARSFDPPLGSTATMLKDLDSVAALARATATPIPMTAVAAELMRLLVARGEAEAEPLRIVTLGDPPRGGS